MTGPYLSLVIPVYNEEAHIEELVSRCVATCSALDKAFEIVLVDDGSRDASAGLLSAAARQYPGIVTAVILNRNYGQHTAVLAGLAEAAGEVIVTLDADLQNPPEEIPRLLAKIDEGCDVVGSVRMQRKDSLFRRISSQLVNRAVRRATGVMMRDYGCMLRAYRRTVVDAILQCHERSTFIPILANSFAGKTGEVEVAHAERANESSRYDLWKLINLQFDLLTCMTTAPLRLLSVFGGLLALGGFAAAIFLLVMRLILGAAWAAEGVFTVFSGLFIFSGVQLLGMGLLGEYLGRVYDDVRSRPRFIVREIITSSAAGTADDRPPALSLTS